MGLKDLLWHANSVQIHLYIRTHVHVHYYLQFLLHRLILGLQNHVFAVLLENLATKVRHGVGDTDLWIQLSPKSAENGVTTFVSTSANVVQ